MTDHRIPMTLPRLGDIMEGGEPLDMFQDALDELERDERIEAVLDGDVDL